MDEVTWDQRIKNGYRKFETPVTVLTHQNKPLHVPSSNFVPSDITKLEQGMRVEHQKFGFGEVLKLEGSSHNPVATIKFDVNGEKKIMLNYAKLMIVTP